ncbi:hypothetical protein AUEXF2481DRAFT_50888, partial [Aureobasidium subglaciale EXF-2481]
VVASQATDDTEWLAAFFPSWGHNIYPVGNHTKGHEAMVYLTYVIDNYHLLPDIVIFLHAARYQWHNDDPLYDNARALSRLQLLYIQKQGYVNLRCAWRPGCPSEIRPHEASVGALSDKFGMRTGPFFAGAFRELLPELTVPEDVGVGCCAQYAVSRQQVLKRPLEDYERFRRWLAETELESSISGRIFEYMWHVLYGKKAVHCPKARDCYCRTYGLCDLECHEPGACDSHPFPKSSMLPAGWPWYGWQGEWQN